MHLGTVDRRDCTMGGLSVGYNNACHVMHRSSTLDVRRSEAYIIAIYHHVQLGSSVHHHARH